MGKIIETSWAKPQAVKIEAYAKENIGWLGEYGNNVSGLI